MGGAVAVVGLVLALVFVVTGLQDLPTGVIRFQAPGEDTVVLSEAGQYLIYHEYPTGSTPTSTSGLRCRLSDQASGSPVTVVPSSGTTWTTGGLTRREIMRFEIARAGTYSVSCSSDTSAGTIDLAIGRPFLRKIFRAVILGIAFFGGGLLIGLAVVMVTVIKRQNSRERLMGWR